NGFYRQGVFQAAGEVHLGVAISLRQGGLIAPALLDAHSKPLIQLMRELLDMTQRCRAGSLRSSELSQSTITVTNLGERGAAEVFGVIYPPQVALVGFGRVVERPWAEGGGLRIMPVVTASLSADHRVSDGHRGALFLVELSDALQDPEELSR
ncbi:2-oxo acid dehydrogenase subunit E2, partial [Burkholderia ubonensis]